MSSQGPGSLPPVSLVRTTCFVMLAGWILLSPSVRQVLQVQTVPFAPAWRMYAGVGVGTCDARYFVRDGASDRPIDRFELEHGVPWSEVKRTDRPLVARDLDPLGRKLCRITGARDLRVDATCATRVGWRQERAREKNLCSR